MSCRVFAYLLVGRHNSISGSCCRHKVTGRATRRGSTPYQFCYYLSYLSDRVAWANCKITVRISCAEDSEKMPRPFPDPLALGCGSTSGIVVRHWEIQEIVAPMKRLYLLRGNGVEPDPPVQLCRHWIDCLLDRSSQTSLSTRHLGACFDISWTTWSGWNHGTYLCLCSITPRRNTCTSRVFKLLNPYATSKYKVATFWDNHFVA